MVAATKKAKDDDSPDSDSASDSRPPTPQKIKYRRPVSSTRRPTRSTSKPSASDQKVAHASNQSHLAKLRTAKQRTRMTPAIKKDEDEDSSDFDFPDSDFSIDSRPATPQKTRPRTPMSSAHRPTRSTSKPSTYQKVTSTSIQPVGAPSLSNFVHQMRGSSVRQPTQSTSKPSTSSRQKFPDHKNPQSHLHSSVSIHQTRGFGTPPQAAGINLPARAADRSDSTQVQPIAQRSDQILDGDRKIAELETKLERMQKAVEDSHAQKRKAEEEHKKERRKWEEEKNVLNQEIVNLCKDNRKAGQVHLEEMPELKARHGKELMEMQMRSQQAEASHQAMIVKLKKEAAQDLEEKMKLQKDAIAKLQNESDYQKRVIFELRDSFTNYQGAIDDLLAQSFSKKKEEKEEIEEEDEEEIEEDEEESGDESDVVVARNEAVKIEKLEKIHARTLLDMQHSHNEKVKQLEEKIKKSARLQEEKDKEHKEKQEILQKIIADLTSEQKAVALMLRFDDADISPSTSNALDGIIELLKSAVTDEMKDKATNVGRKRPRDGSPINKTKKIRMEEDEDSD
ncbi:hypothetical protein CAEBREN_09083 [Caenorhabditis brenneri]|uniref:Uncharacterized protein n=1 Tax=Caenorhabditis brenneri TaxID=135651 RepID=G0P456_CAEBE|nr:hypothetical protein CAEBREN_09083 [Caenorhabditis brenneri]